MPNTARVVFEDLPCSARAAWTTAVGNLSSAASYDDSGLTAGNIYFYRTVAFNSGGPYSPIPTPIGTGFANTGPANGTTYFYINWRFFIDATLEFP